MKIVLLFTLILTSTSFALEVKNLEGSWSRQWYEKVPRTDNLKGVGLERSAGLHFTKDTVLIYEGNERNLVGKSEFSIMKRDGQDFIVYYGPKQDPKDLKVQEKQGYFVEFSEKEDGQGTITFYTVKEHEKNASKKRYEGITYKEMDYTHKDIPFVFN